MPAKQQRQCYQHAILLDGTIWTDVIKRDVLLIAYYLPVHLGYNIAYIWSWCLIIICTVVNNHDKLLLCHSNTYRNWNIYLAFKQPDSHWLRSLIKCNSLRLIRHVHIHLGKLDIKCKYFGVYFNHGGRRKIGYENGNMITKAQITFIKKKW